MADGSPILDHVQPAAAAVSEPNYCACGMAPKRPWQHNCRACHALANRIYRARLRHRREIEHALAVHAILEKQWKRERDNVRHRRRGTG
jgi:hypothetical protein